MQKMGRMKKLMDQIPPVSSSSEEETDDDSDVEPMTQKSKPALEPEKPLKSKAEESSEEETDDDEEEEESDDEEEAKSKSKPDTPVVKKTPEPATPEASMESDAEGESGSDDDSVVDTKSPSASAFTIKPAAAVSKPAIESKQKDINTNANTTPVKVTGKRALETQLNGKDSKVKKSKASNKEDNKEDEEEDAKTDEKKSGGVSRWTEKDEIAVLNGLIRYKSEKGPDVDMGLLADSLKGSIRSNISKTQLNDKVRRLRKKFLTILEKSENGKDLSRPHDSALFDLSKRIWNSAGKFIHDETENGAIKNNTTLKKSNKKAEKPEGKKIVPKEEIKSIVAADEPIRKEVNIEVKEEMGLDEILEFPSMSEDDLKKYFQKTINIIGPSKAKEIHDQWKKLQVEEFEIYTKKMAIRGELSKLVLDAMKN